MSNMLELTSVFENGERIPTAYTADGQDISPPLTVENITPEAESLVLIADDPDAPMGTFTHWLLWNVPLDKKKIEIPVNIPGKERVKQLGDACQGKNGFGDLGYMGPAPPSGTHTYRFKVFTLDTMLDLEPGADKSTLNENMKGHILQQATLKGDYSRH